MLNKIFFICIFFSCCFFANTSLAFNPNSSHHILLMPDDKGPFPAILMLHASSGIEKVTIQ